ncbi:WD40-repeat-containing domain protein [Pseudomassariella vexata]|uniref:ASTRA-associated protein 1 n=1 Tax=Pseudomassariella vexata TaxID=1141098 RepID=A0A1Y2DJV4_9PEZI|nr:WD40-repeat-containing domain protein [Pseudomassariella vexata]ORY59528.1 WD40-repeat-containing domain protein [Pseudomassariella vexata]
MVEATDATMASPSQLPSAQPRSILRGHQAQVHAAAFVRGNQRLASGDAEGYVVLWDLTIMRPRAVWRAHTNAILGIASWGMDKIITHGRDNQLIVWKVSADDEAALSTTLPLDPSLLPRPQPWILHILEVNTMNFCSFSICPVGSNESNEELLVAVPNTLVSEAVDVYQLPSQNRLHTIHPTDKAEENGMVMSLALFHLDASLALVTAYENGITTVLQLDGNGEWVVLYRAQSHSQPVLSLSISPSCEYFITSGADALVVKHPIPRQSLEQSASEQPLQQRFGDSQQARPVNGKSLLSAALSVEPNPAQPSLKKAIQVRTKPLKVLNSKHSGQQSLRIRSDGKIFATAGWDSKVRVYSAQTMRELAVLKWHQAGCYAVAFTTLNCSTPEAPVHEESTESTANAEAVATTSKMVNLNVKDRRIKQARQAHWLAAGSKDGKISLWDIY